MPEEYADKRLAAAAGLAKGITEWVKSQQEAKIQQNATESQMLRTMFPLLFRQQQFEQEQQQEWKMFESKEEREREAERAKAARSREEMALKLKEFDRTLEDMRAKREEWKADYELRKGTLSETERHNKATESLGYLSESIELMQSMLSNLTQITISGTFTDKKTAAEELEKLRGQIQEDTGEALQKLRDSAAATAREEEQTFEESMLTKREEAVEPGREAAEWRRTAKEWKDDVTNFLTNSWQMYEWEKKPNDINRAEKVKRALDAFEAQRLSIPEQYRPRASELPLMESGVDRQWPIPNVPPKLIYRTAEPPTAAPGVPQETAPDAAPPATLPTLERLKRLGKTVERPSVQTTSILKKYGLSDDMNLLGAARSLHDDEEAWWGAWWVLRQWLQKNGVSDDDLRKIWEGLH